VRRTEDEFEVAEMERVAVYKSQLHAAPGDGVKKTLLCLDVTQGREGVVIPGGAVQVESTRPITRKRLVHHNP
jgi:hypothetical protein